MIARLLGGGKPKYDTRTMPYWEYLQTPEWEKVRQRALKRAGYRCQKCRRTNQQGAVLQVHHLTYERRGAERDADLQVLCKNCHDRVHGKNQPWWRKLFG